jgi:uncharacterized SAM-binding protein YcdF (DUF218 family)
MRILAWIVGVVVALVLAGVAIIVGIGFFLSPQDKLRHADVIVAVSGGETEQRTKEAIELYRSGYAPKLLFSGAAQDKNGPSNAAAMRSTALHSGVPAKDILVEESSVNTAENAKLSAPIITTMGAHNVILVTSPYHQRRASTNFHQALGDQVTIINHSATDSSWRKNSWWHDPYTVDLTMSELKKTIYVSSTKPESRQ